MLDMLAVGKARVEEVVDEAPGLKTFVLKPERGFSFLPGQFLMVSRLGAGESPFAISSSPAKPDTVSVSVQDVGKHTRALFELDPGDEVAVRGPYGNSFPLGEWKGRNVFVIGGGIGMAPLRPVIYSLLDNLREYTSVTLVLGSRTPELLPYKRELDEWQKKVPVHRTIDKPCEGWSCMVGMVPVVLEELRLPPAGAVAALCGPPLMIRSGWKSLEGLGFAPEQVYTTLEMKMKCGVGVCGRCNIDSRYICKDGPVFRMDEIKV
jgi:sulfhydrogenase subunit gamma (sulfur reductase)